MTTIVTRASKALPLTHNEVDANFNNLNADKLEISSVQRTGSNTRIGSQALASITTGTNCTAIGVNSLINNTTGFNNSAIGVNSLASLTVGSSNMACGYYALPACTTGSNCTASGAYALQDVTTGIANTGLGVAALANLTTGSGNIGFSSMNSSGTYAPVFNVTTENNRVVMGSWAVTNAYIQVAWTVVSDARDKTNFAPVPHGLAFINALKPTAYQFREDRTSTETNGPVRYGFLAQDILSLEGSGSVIIDAEDPEKLRYNGESLVPVLVNAIQELSAMVDNLKAELSTLKGA